MSQGRRFNAMLGIYDTETDQLTDRDNFVIDALKSSFIDPKVEVIKPQIIFSIREKGAMQFNLKRVFTLGNFSAIIGKAKSKKTYLLSAICAAILSGRLMWDKFHGEKQDDKTTLLYFDTEQSDYDSWNVVRRIVLMAGKIDGFRAYNLRRFTPKERRDIINFAMDIYGKESGFVVIDGVADLVNSINSEEEASEVSTMLLRLTKDYNCHICNVIHQNKGDGYATGHIGSYIMKKCEVIIRLTKDENNSSESRVECDMIRGTSDFNPFTLRINPDGIPEIDNVVIDVDNKFKVIDESCFEIRKDEPF